MRRALFPVTVPSRAALSAVMTAGNFSGEQQDSTLDYMSAGGLKDILGGSDFSLEPSSQAAASAAGAPREGVGRGAEGEGDASRDGEVLPPPCCLLVSRRGGCLARTRVTLALGGSLGCVVDVRLVHRSHARRMFGRRACVHVDAGLSWAELGWASCPVSRCAL